jgi:hypothetical protein
MTESPSDEPAPRPAEAEGQPDGPAEAGQPSEVSFGRSFGALWLYTILRFLLFGLLFAVLWLFSVPTFLAAVLALLLSVPLSYVLLARPRAVLAGNVEARLAARRARGEELNAQLKGDEGNAPSDPS